MSAATGFVIGIDGGASKTAAIIASTDGAVFCRRRGPGSAIIGRPHAAAVDVLASVLRELTEAAGTSLPAVARIVMGLSGVDYAHETPEQARLLAEGLGLDPTRLLLVNDSIVALAGATTTARSVIVQHGTEVTLAYRSAPGAEQVFDSLGVADCFDLRHRAVPLVARMIDGRAAATPLREAVLAHCDVPAARFAEWVLRDPDARRTVLEIAPVVFRCWVDGDPAAAALVTSAVEDYVTAAAAMGKRLGPGPLAACFGGGTIAVGGPKLLDAITWRLAEICPEAQPMAPEHAPEAGAALMALHGLGLPTEALLRQLKRDGELNPRTSSQNDQERRHDQRAV